MRHAKHKYNFIFMQAFSFRTVAFVSSLVVTKFSPIVRNHVSHFFFLNPLYFTFSLLSLVCLSTNVLRALFSFVDIQLFRVPFFYCPQVIWTLFSFTQPLSFPHSLCVRSPSLLNSNSSTLVAHTSSNNNSHGTRVLLNALH